MCSNHIVPMAFEFFMPPEIIQALKVLDVDNDGKISLSDVRDVVVQVHVLQYHFANIVWSLCYH